jgi:hypothetical protein
MRILTTRPPQDSDAEPFPVSLFRVGETYEVGPQLAARLITAGYAASDNEVAAKHVEPKGDTHT